MARGDTRPFDPASVPALAGCADATRSALAAAEPATFAPGARLWTLGAAAPLVVLVKGAIKLERPPVVVDVARGPALACDVGFADEAPATTDAIALRASIAIVLTRADARRLRDPALDAAARAAVYALHRAFARRVDATVRGDVDKRLVAVIVELAERFGASVGGGLFVALPLRRRDLAAMVGATPETASRVLARLEEAGLVRARREGLWVAASVLRPGLREHGRRNRNAERERE